MASNRTMLVVLFVSLTPALVGQAADRARGTAPVAAPGDTAGRVAELVEQLGSSDYSRREAADARLREQGMEIIPLLTAAYDETDDFETRVRIQRIAEHLYYWNRVLKFNGFLGISHTHYRRSSFTQHGVADVRVRPGTSAFYVERVIEGTAAERAGLHPGDLIVAVDGETIPEKASPTDFADRIRIKPPGTPMTFDIYRGNQFMSKQIKIGFRPPQYYRNATPELRRQWEKAVAGFDAWWTAHFANRPADGRQLIGDDDRFLPVGGAADEDNGQERRSAADSGDRAPPPAKHGDPKQPAP